MDKKLFRSARPASIVTRVPLGIMDVVAQNIRRTEMYDMTSDTGDDILWKRSRRRKIVLTLNVLIIRKKQKAHRPNRDLRNLNIRKYR